MSLSELISETQSPLSSKDRDFSRLHASIEALSPIYREIICMRFGLCGYGVHRLCDTMRILGISKDVANWRFRHAKAMLRQYTELLDLVGSHT